MAEGGDLYCICRSSYSVGVFMIQCDRCEDWFHGSCVGISEEQSSHIDQYHCPNCAPQHGPMKLKPRRNVQRHNYQDLEAGRVAQADSNRLMFIRQLQARTFPPGDDIVQCLSGAQLTKSYLEEHGFARPMMVHDKAGLGIKVPSHHFNIPDVQQCVGPLRKFNVIDVATQEDSSMHMHEWTEYFCQPSAKRRRTLNVISLEFSDTKLDEVVESPSIVRQIDWLGQCWPHDKAGVESRPKIQKYVLMSTQGSYTDFHIDFGGSSVWYHVLWGEKIFYMIRPTLENLERFEKWSSSPNQNEVFFGDEVEQCYQCRVQAGQTFFIPTGWIHAVLTPADSLVFGGNFLHSYNMLLQLWVYGMETRIKMQARLLLPAFETLHWHAATMLLAELKGRIKASSNSTTVVPSYLYQGVEALLKACKTWTSSEGLKFHKVYIPDGVTSHRLVHSLGKALKNCKPATPVSDTTPLVVHSTTNPLKLTINSKALSGMREVKTEAAASSRGEASVSSTVSIPTSSSSSSTASRSQPVAKMAVKPVGGNSLKLRLTTKPAAAADVVDSRKSSKKVSLAGWDRVVKTKHKTEQHPQDEESDGASGSGSDDESDDSVDVDAAVDTGGRENGNDNDNGSSAESSESASSDADADSSAFGDSASDESTDGESADAENSDGFANTSTHTVFELASPGLEDPSLPLRAAGKDEDDWTESNQPSGMDQRVQPDRTRGADNSWHPGTRLDVFASSKGAKRSHSKQTTKSAKRPCKPPSPPVEQAPRPTPQLTLQQKMKQKKGSATAKQRLGKKLKLDPRALYRR